MPEQPEQNIVRIPARSQQQVMDWSLVLASQEIDTVIDFSPEPPHWGLIVAPPDYERARAAIAQYQIENRAAWPWRRELIEADTVFDAGSIVWAMLIMSFFWVQNARDYFTGAGALDSNAIGEGQWWRLFTAIMLHGDAAHLATNLVFGVSLLGLAMGRYGTGIGLLASYLAGVFGNLVSWLLGPAQFVSLGASGMVFGGLGLLAAQSVAVWWKTRHAPRYALGGLFAAVMLFVLLGLSPRSNILAHAGGFVCGVVLGTGLALWRPLASDAIVNFFAGLSFGILVLVPWLIALNWGS